MISGQNLEVYVIMPTLFLSRHGVHYCHMTIYVDLKHDLVLVCRCNLEFVFFTYLQSISKCINSNSFSKVPPGNQEILSCKKKHLTRQGGFLLVLHNQYSYKSMKEFIYMGI